MTDQLDWVRTERQKRTRQLRDEGIQRSLTAAERRAEGWAEWAYSALVRYCQAAHLLTAEEVREWAHRVLDLPEPPDPRAWGGIFQRAVRAGIVVRDGYRPHRDPSRHGAPSMVWRVQRDAIAAHAYTGRRQAAAP